MVLEMRDGILSNWPHQCSKPKKVGGDVFRVKDLRAAKNTQNTGGTAVTSSRRHD